MKVAKITIPRIEGYPVMYVYRALRAEDINTIEKVRKQTPISVINWAIGGEQSMMFYDAPEDYGNSNYFHSSYVNYIGPLAAPVPVTEYSPEISIAKFNDFTYANVLKMEPLPIPYNGTVYYYSVIGVNLNNNTMTHLSKVSGILLDCDYKSGSRHIYSCNDYDMDSQDNEWTYIGAVSWNEPIEIGNVENPATFERFGIPVVETVPAMTSDDMAINTRFLYTSSTMILDIINPWCKNNSRFNYRKMKSYKIQNVYHNIYGEFSYPTHQSLLPVPIERMTIMWCAKENSEPIPLQAETDDIKRIDVIRKNGIFYDINIHRPLGSNIKDHKLGVKTAVYTETSINNRMQFRLPGSAGNRYVFTVYLTDTYGNVSEPAVYTSDT
jgi:hypothetical protein